MKPTFTISVVMAVYSGDTAQAFLEAIESLLRQSCLPEEIIIVVDGPVTNDIEVVLRRYKSHDLISIISLKENMGRGKARNLAIQQARGDLVAIMDADDICRVDRLLLQRNFFQSNRIDFLGGQIEEFDRLPGDLGDFRIVPLEQEDILRTQRYRSPFNHVTLMFKRSAFVLVGGYRDLKYVEDWDLYFRIMGHNVVVANIEDVLTDVRRAVHRRRSLGYFFEEVFVLRQAFARGQLGISVFCLSLTVRFMKFVIPQSILNACYTKIFRQQNLRKRVQREEI